MERKSGDDTNNLKNIYVFQNNVVNLCYKTPFGIILYGDNYAKQNYD